MCRATLPAAGSARVAFASGLRLAVIALLDGSVLAFKVHTSCLQQQQQMGDEGQSLCSRLWCFKCPVPVFSSPVADEHQVCAGQPAATATTTTAAEVLTARSSGGGGSNGAGALSVLQLMEQCMAWSLSQAAFYGTCILHRASSSSSSQLAMYLLTCCCSRHASLPAPAAPTHQPACSSPQQYNQQQFSPAQLLCLS